ncbi:hypothetical protein L6164_007576 [Bauhinia variegata]|uniref:Uncharacterized protein n=1 Tax=Bauhinia variegata TaxID=167791 RepID=A0ACB9PED3_BAUVA|nr:hypothetical protein L6164_007576 [Bauhinia variegata]
MGIFSHCFGNGSKSAKQPSSSSPVEQLCHRFSLAELKLATGNFNLGFIGEDAFGVLYNVLLNNNGTRVVVKRFKKYSMFNGPEMKNEVLLLCQLRHPNLLSLIGFCEEKNEFIAVYEHTPNGYLRDLLHGGKDKVNPLPWKRRLQICVGVARGLHYLHAGARYAIIHRDLHSQHIFLDENWEPKIAGLNLSKRGPLSVSRKLIRVNSRVMGTCGIAEPEYAATGDLTEKVDVFAFGIMLLEIVSAKTPSYCFMEKNHILEATLDDEIVDPFLKSKIATECWEVFIDVTRRCLLEQRVERPNMGEVEVELELALRLQEEADDKIECSISGEDSGAKALTFRTTLSEDSLNNY